MTSEVLLDRVRVTLGEEGIAEVALARAGKMNALDAAMFEAIRAAILRLQGIAELRAVVLHGEGPSFCAGLDKSSFEQIVSGAGADGLRDLLTRTHGRANAWQQVAWGWRELRVPVIAALHGAAFGGGLQIALGADIRYATADTKLSVMEMKWGLVPDMGGCVFLTELTRPDVARELTFTGRVVSGAEAAALGLVTRVCEDPLAQAREDARRMVRANPDAIAAAKRIFNQATPVDAGRVLMHESLEQQQILGAPNQVEAVKAALEGRPQRFV